MKRSSPIAIFVHRRPEHTRRLLLSLLANPPASQSAIHIYCDGARYDREAPEVERARAVVRELAPKHARIVERDANLGLAKSVVAGVSELVEAHGEVIVLEDDLELSPVALEYFNAALERYLGEERVMHVSGYMYPVRAALPETFFYREATCWGWATWARAWRHFEPDAMRIRSAVIERGARRAFDAEGSSKFFGMLQAQIDGRVDSWAIRWYGSMWMRGGLALHPGQSLVRNTGLDGSGEHHGLTGAYDVDLGAAPVRVFPDSVKESAEAMRAMVSFRKEVRAQERAALWQSVRRRLLAWRT